MYMINGGARYRSEELGYMKVGAQLTEDFGLRLEEDRDGVEIDLVRARQHQ